MVLSMVVSNSAFTLNSSLKSVSMLNRIWYTCGEPSMMTFPSYGMGSGRMVLVIMYPILANGSSISSRSVEIICLRPSHTRGSRNICSAGMTRKPPLARWAVPARTMV